MSKCAPFASRLAGQSAKNCNKTPFARSRYQMHRPRQFDNKNAIAINCQRQLMMQTTRPCLSSARAIATASCSFELRRRQMLGILHKNFLSQQYNHKPYAA
jgi:hypothetical protein